jgi:hypothetical protein
VLVTLAFHPVVPVALSSEMSLLLYGTSTVFFIFSTRLADGSTYDDCIDHTDDAAQALVIRPSWNVS